MQAVVDLRGESGAGAEARTTVAAQWSPRGTTLGTLLMLFVMPALYVLLSGFSPPCNALEIELETLELDNPAGGQAHPVE